jgi:fumarylacetoacetase
VTPAGGPFGIETLPYGSFTTPGLAGGWRVGVAYGAHVLDLTAASAVLLPEHAGLFAAGTLDGLLGAGPEVWARVRAAVTEWLTEERHRAAVEPLLVPAWAARTRLPFTVADYVDFYASEHHATNLGRILRPGGEPLTPNWRHMPIGYHGRAGTVVVSGTPVVRPQGQLRDGAGPTFGPSLRLDIEAEVGFVVGTPSTPGRPVPLADAGRHIFGACLVNDWSARDIQAWEYVPLGPFLGKSFATSLSPWIVPLAALEHARVAPPPREPRPLPYLDDTREAAPWGFDLALTVTLNGHAVARPPFAAMYWTAAQQLAHLTANGAWLRTGDLLASGTVSGPERGQRGSLIELTWNGAEPLRLPDGSARSFLADGDEVVITASAPGPGGARVGFGEVRGRVLPAGTALSDDEMGG